MATLHIIKTVPAQMQSLDFIAAHAAPSQAFSQADFTIIRRPKTPWVNWTENESSPSHNSQIFLASFDCRIRTVRVTSQMGGGKTARNARN
jgi:hypothetical protein